MQKRGVSRVIILSISALFVMLSVVAAYTPPEYTYTVVSGSLPPGLSLIYNTGDITGTPTVAGTYYFDVKSQLVSSSTTQVVSVTSTSITIDPLPPTCSDGIQNQGETGIDCGGPCSVCASGPSSSPPFERNCLIDIFGLHLFCKDSNSGKPVFFSFN